MKQQDLGLNLTTRRTRKGVFLDEMELEVPWNELVTLIATHAPKKATGRPPFAVETMLRIHFLRQWLVRGEEADVFADAGYTLRRDRQNKCGRRYARDQY